jgi:hypothetical protein
MSRGHVLVTTCIGRRDQAPDSAQPNADLDMNTRGLERTILRLAWLGLAFAAVGIGSYLFGLYSYPRALWPASMLRGLGDTVRKAGVRDDYDRLVAYPGKIETACPAQTERTGVLLAIGQSNISNHAATRVTTRHGRKVVNYFVGKCTIAASPLLGASGDGGEFLTMLADRLVDDGVYDTVVIVSSGIGGSPISRWQAGGDLNAMLTATLRDLAGHFRVTDVVWHQGESDFANATTSEAYAAAFASLVATLTQNGVPVPIYTSVSTRCGPSWRADSPVARAQRGLAADGRVHVAADTDALLAPEDRYDECHFSESGQRKAATAYAAAIRQFRQPRQP